MGIQFSRGFTIDIEPNGFLAENLDLFGMFDLNSRDADVLSPVDLGKVPQKS